MHEDDFDDLADEYESETYAVLLLPGWRHPNTGKLHIRRDCRAVQYHGATMTPVLIRLDDDKEVKRVFSDDARCRYCFPQAATIIGGKDSES